ncbi:MAG: hypothetical protein VB074_13815 [Proteiniphilum sp.]|jgi:hypothetical protein|uniref:hypothetical protein n=1 Tax=Proteiniphilum sp. TaxID=1926877 RepID=UPI002B202921|nr:hypothetical protein [Proteiniphilum sp.]MEA5129254.1 hypothetical protein [Proteiniphilum sp.]
MKKLSFILAAFALFVISCNNAGQTKNDQESQQTTEETAVVAYDADSLYAIAESMIDKEIAVRGYVTHTCKHSGKRCFLTGEGQQHSIRVEAKGEIGGFNRELEGSQLVVNGILRERRLTQAEIADIEKSTNEKLSQEDGSAETCAAELANINEMKEWMKAQGKDYYSIYYIDGLNYEEIHN